MRMLRAAVFALAVFGTALPLSARDDDDDKPTKKDDKKDDSKKDDSKKDDSKKDDKKEDKLRECEYYPLAIGTTWTYDVNGQTLTIKVAELEKVKDVLCARLETESAGSVVASEHVSVQEDGIFRHSINGMKIEPPLCIMKLPYKKGAEWKVKSKQGGNAIKGKITSDEEDDLDVPAGTFKTIVAKGEFTTNGQTFTTAAYFAKGKGIVKQEMQIAGQTITIELKKFKKGTGKATDGDDDDDKKDDEKKPEKKDDKKDKDKDKKDDDAPKKKDF